jgi:uncharacterized membrane protein
MAFIEDATLGVHIVAGFIALLAGAGALVTKKGGQRHRRLGRFYVYGMAVVFVTSFVLLAIDQTISRIILGFIAVFSFYFAYSGYRVLSRKRPADRPEIVDWLAVALLGVSSLGLFASGGWLLSEGIDFGIVMLLFGGISVGTAAMDVRRFRSDEQKPREWFFEHLTRMGAAYTATVTAFVSANFSFLPEAVLWLVPTGAGFLLIWYMTRHYKQKFGLTKAATAE